MTETAADERRVLEEMIDQLLYPTRHRALEVDYLSRLVDNLAILAREDESIKKQLISRIRDSEADSLFPLIFAFIEASESIPILEEIASLCHWARLALTFQKQQLQRD